MKALTQYPYTQIQTILWVKLNIRVNQGYTIQPANIESSNNSAHLPLPTANLSTMGLVSFCFRKYADLVRWLLMDKDVKDCESVLSETTIKYGQIFRFI